MFDKIQNKLRHQLDRRMQPGHDPSERTTLPHNGPSNGGVTNGRMKWPPQLFSIDIMGEQLDVQKHRANRDGGHSFKLGNHWYVWYGDTFCHTPSGEFIGLTNNTIAMVPDTSNPLRTKYETGPTEKVPEFIPFVKDEVDANAMPANQETGKRVVNWAFGAVWEDQPGSGQGWMLTDTCEMKGEAQCMCAVRVTSNLETGAIKAERHGGPIWGPGKRNETVPFGNAATLVHPTDGYVYLMGGFVFVNYFARLRIGDDPSIKENYSYWMKDGTWAPSFSYWDHLQPVLGSSAQGEILYMPDHGPAGKPFVWIGVDKWGDSKIWIKAAERIEGPYEEHCLGELPKYLGNDSRNRYCLYTHTWCSRPGSGELVLSWSDDGRFGGVVVVANMRYAVE